MVPFTLKAPGKDEYGPSMYRSVTWRFHGIAKLDGNQLILEFAGEKLVDQVKGAEVKSWSETVEVRQVVLPVGKVGRIEVKGWLRVRIELWATDLGLLDSVPGANQGRITLRIARRDRLEAQELAATVRLASADSALYSAGQLPPGL